MPRLTKVWIWPAEGKTTKPWDESPEIDSFLKTSRRVSEAFRQALERHNIRTRDPEIEIMLDDEVGDRDIVVQAIERGVDRGPESATITVSRDFHRLDEYTRAFFVADALHAIATRLGTVHGWHLAAINSAMDAVRVEDYAFEWVGPWKPNADKTMRVRVRARLLDDGFGRVRLEFAGADDTTPVSSTGEVVAGTTRGDFKRISKSVAWSGGNAVTARGLGRGFAASADSGQMRSLSPVKQPLANFAEPDPALPLPRIVVADAPPISFTIGGGPVNKVPKKYVAQLDDLFAHLCDDEGWVAWWLQFGVADVELEYDFDSKVISSRITVAGERMTCSVLRPAKSVAKGLDGIAMARADVMALLDAVRVHTGRDSHPPLPMQSEAS